jgi:hypothetical protein
VKKKQKITFMMKRFIHFLDSKKNQILLVSCISLFSLNLFSKENNDSLYLITGNINIPGNYYSYLFRYNNHSLDTVAVLSTDSTQLKFIKAYHDQRKVVILKDGYIYNNNYILQVIPMDNPIENIKTLNMGDGNNLFEKNLVKYNDSLYYIFENAGEYWGININSLKKRVFDSPEILTNAVIKGDLGGLMEINTYDYILLDHNVKGDSVFVSISGEKYYFKLRIPDCLISTDKKYYAIMINTDNYLVIWNKSSEYNQSKSLGSSNVIIYDRVGQQWHKLKLKGNNVHMLNFNNWLGGWITESYDDKNGLSWESPGENVRKKENNSLGSTFDERASISSVYMPGILYLYNLETKQYIEWETGQGDSEILILQNKMVYYRVNDKIFKRPIYCGKELSLGDPELIIQNEIIMDVHWAFMANKP